jgi:hypothetical protein
MLAGVCAGDVEPVSVNIDRLTEINIYRCIVRHFEAIAYRFVPATHGPSSTMGAVRRGFGAPV